MPTTKDGKPCGRNPVTCMGESIISDRTKIQLPLVISLIGAVVYLVYWGGGINNSLQGLTKSVDKLAKNQEAFTDKSWKATMEVKTDFSNVNSRVTALEVSLKRLDDATDKRLQDLLTQQEMQRKDLLSRTGNRWSEKDMMAYHAKYMEQMIHRITRIEGKLNIESPPFPLERKDRLKQ
jgi:hypothetical protein